MPGIASALSNIRQTAVQLTDKPAIRQRDKLKCFWELHNILKSHNLKKNEYKMTVEKNVIIEYSGKESLRNALATLIQSVVKDGNGFKIRYRAINDYSDCGYRG